ncbi:helix-turn-helix domain-containing protein [Flagellimonas olearia]|uniref:Helix-turn-helix domain-containing protein n=1 Tax=Flagellimonas olearia TaxID=552546 RepID=A0A6I1E4D6_9FLAO|nr:helix-turn-helix transcriptional regulator [Allomuricauda olearia]KAB7528436.1 helix-turn-helix domain-containing protein [Allomuricauda olearia]
MILDTINRLRKEKKITIAELAEKIGMSPVTLQRNLSTGSKLKIDDLEAIIKVLGEEHFYFIMLAQFKTYEFVKMDIQDGEIWGIFLINGEPKVVGLVDDYNLALYFKEGERYSYDIPRLEFAVGPDVGIWDIKEDNNIVNMWIYQYERKSGPTR